MDNYRDKHHKDFEEFIKNYKKEYFGCLLDKVCLCGHKDNIYSCYCGTYCCDECDDDGSCSDIYCPSALATDVIESIKNKDSLGYCDLDDLFDRSNEYKNLFIVNLMFEISRLQEEEQKNYISKLNETLENETLNNITQKNTQ